MNFAKEIVSDGEGATKTILIEVKRSRSEKEALTIARAVALSPLVKTAFHGEDPNWGRILSSAGSTTHSIDTNRLDIAIGDLPVFRKGRPVTSISRNIRRIMKQKYISVTINLNQGRSNGMFYTCDLSPEYVRINADYTT